MTAAPHLRVPPPPAAYRCAGECDPLPTVPRRCSRCGWAVYAPQKGPQTLFDQCEADIAIYGGKRGGGKSYALLFEGLKGVALPGYEAIVFRRLSTELGGLVRESEGLYPLLGGTLRSSPNIDWSFPSGAEIHFRHLQREESWESHRGRQYCFIGWDELTQFTENQFWKLWSSCRTTCGRRAYMRATCNPDADSWVRKLIDWWIDEEGYPIPERSGVLRYFVRGDDDELLWADTPEELREATGRAAISFTFIAAGLEDNAVLLAADPGYRAKLENLTRVDRLQFLGGNWNVRLVAGTLFKRDWFQVVDEPPSPPIFTVRHWDKAATEPRPDYPNPDWTRGAKVSLLADGRLIIHHIDGLRKTPGAVNDRILSIAAQDGKAVVVGLWRDPGQAGVADVEHTTGLLDAKGFAHESIVASRDKLGYAKIWSSKAERGEILVLRGAWNDGFFDEAEGFPDSKVHDDMIDSISGAVQVLEDEEVQAYAATLAYSKSKKKKGG